MFPSTPSPEIKILLAQSDFELAKVTRAILENQDFHVITAADGDEALKIISSEQPRLAVLDTLLPRVSGFEICRQIRDRCSLLRPSVLSLTAGADEAEIAFTLGADDCVNKPVNLPELMVRIRRLLRLMQAPTPDTDEISVEDLHLDIPRHRATVEGRPVHLTATEFKLLRVLAQRRGRVQTRERLLQDVWEYNCSLTTRTVDTHIRRLRQKLGQSCRHLEAVRGIGYRFAE